MTIDHLAAFNTDDRAGLEYSVQVDGNAATQLLRDYVPSPTYARRRTFTDPIEAIRAAFQSGESQDGHRGAFASGGEP